MNILITYKAVFALSLALLSCHQASVAANSNCASCSKRSWVGFGDSDPHLSVWLRNSTLDRPVCYDVDGKSGEMFRLFRVGNLTVDATMIPSPRFWHKNDGTYFGSFTFTMGPIEVQVTPLNITVSHKAKATTLKGDAIPWLARVSKNSTCFSEPAVNFTVVHFKRKVMMVVFDGTVFEIKKNLLKYGKDKRNFYYLGIYFSPNEESSYGGLIGEVVDLQAVHTKSGSEDFLVIGADKKIRVEDRQRTDLLNNKVFKCWFVDDIQKLLSEPLSQLKRRAFP